MTLKQFKNLKQGDIVRHKNSSKGVTVMSNYGDYVFAVRTYHLSQPNEWDLIYKAVYEKNKELTIGRE